MSRKLGITEQQLTALADFETSDAFNDQERLVLRYAVAMTQTPVDVPDELFNALQQQFDPKQIVELTSAIAWENYRARFDHAFGIEASGFSQGTFCPLPAGQAAKWAGHGKSPAASSADATSQAASLFSLLPPVQV